MKYDKVVLITYRNNKGYFDGPRLTQLISLRDSYVQYVLKKEGYLATQENEIRYSSDRGYSFSVVGRKQLRSDLERPQKDGKTKFRKSRMTSFQPQWGLLLISILTYIQENPIT